MYTTHATHTTRTIRLLKKTYVVHKHLDFHERITGWAVCVDNTDYWLAAECASNHHKAAQHVRDLELAP